MELLFGDADITGQEPINHSHDSCPQKASAKVLQEQMKDKMAALSATNRNVIGEALTQLIIKVSRVLFIFCKILLKYILHSSNLYDLGNSPVA